MTVRTRCIFCGKRAQLSAVARAINAQTVWMEKYQGNIGATANPAARVPCSLRTGSGNFGLGGLMSYSRDRENHRGRSVDVASSSKWPNSDRPTTKKKTTVPN